MKRVIIILCLAVFVSGCEQKTTNAGTTELIPTNPIEGTWKMVYADTRQNDSIQVKNLENTRFIKIINKSHFAFFNQEQGTSDNFFAGGGTYTLRENEYTETLEFVGATDIRGHVFKFNVEIKGDSLIQQGHEKVEKAQIDRYILEKYIRIKK